MAGELDDVVRVQWGKGFMQHEIHRHDYVLCTRKGMTRYFKCRDCGEYGVKWHCENDQGLCERCATAIFVAACIGDEITTIEHRDQKRKTA